MDISLKNVHAKRTTRRKKQMQKKKRLSLIFQEKLNRIRAERGLSCAALGKLAEVDPASISLWERGLRIPALDSVEKLAIGLDVDVYELLKENL